MEKYNIIHVRYLTLVIKQNDPTVVLDNLLKILITFHSPSGPYKILQMAIPCYPYSQF